MSKHLSIAALRETGMDEVYDTQACFRSLMQAFAEPGVWRQLPVPELRACPRDLYPASFAVIKTMCDHMVSVWISSRTGMDACTYVSLNTGTTLSAIEDADYALIDQEEAAALALLRLGNEEFPERSTLAMVQTTAESALDRFFTARGPGIATTARFSAPAECQAIFAGQAALKTFPLGVDLLLIRPDGTVCALPRTLEITWPM